MEAREPYRIYKELAEREAERGAEQLRDRLLILAADAALAAGKKEEAEHLSDLLLQVNPTHMLKPFPSFAEAVQSAEVASYIADLRRNYPPEEAERLLQALHGPAPAEAPATPAAEPPPPPPPKVELETSALMPPAPAPLPEAAPPLIPPPYRPEPVVPAPAEAEEEAGGSAVSYYVATGLFIILLVAALALAGHVLVRPFLL